MSTVTAVPAFTRQERGVTTMDGKSDLEDCLVVEWMARNGSRQKSYEQETDNREDRNENEGIGNNCLRWNTHYKGPPVLGIAK